MLSLTSSKLLLTHFTNEKTGLREVRWLPWALHQIGDREKIWIPVYPHVIHNLSLQMGTRALLVSSPKLHFTLRIEAQPMLVLTPSLSCFVPVPLCPKPYLLWSFLPIPPHPTLRAHRPRPGFQFVFTATGTISDWANNSSPYLLHFLYQELVSFLWNSISY